MMLSKTLIMWTAMWTVCSAVLIRISDPVRPEPPETEFPCPDGYHFFNNNFSEFRSRQYITQIQGWAGITALATPFLPRGYTPIPPGRHQPHNPWGGAARVMRTSMRHCKADRDLCTPHRDFGGDGVGHGGAAGMVGANEYYQGNAVIIQERDKLTPDDNAFGGGLLMEMTSPRDFRRLTFGLIDVGSKGGDERRETAWPPSFLLVRDMFGLPDLQLVPDLGDNSFQEVVFEKADFAQAFILRFQGSGALSYVKGCQKNATLPGDLPERPDKCA